MPSSRYTPYPHLWGCSKERSGGAEKGLEVVICSQGSTNAVWPVMLLPLYITDPSEKTHHLHPFARPRRRRAHTQRNNTLLDTGRWGFFHPAHGVPFWSSEPVFGEVGLPVWLLIACLGTLGGWFGVCGTQCWSGWALSRGIKLYGHKKKLATTPPKVGIRSQAGS